MGPERTALPYSGRHRAEKAILFERINADRALHGVPPVRYDPQAEGVGDLFCVEAAVAGFTGHWDLSGRAPYLRWGLAGGVDYHEQNAAAYSNSSGVLGRALADLLLASHEAMMAEVPPDDGHRRTILDPNLTHVGIGLATLGGELRMTEEFTRVAFEWIEVPEGPLPAGAVASFAAMPLRGFVVGPVEVRFEPPPTPLSLFELRQRRSYAYPRVIHTLRPSHLVSSFHQETGWGEFEVQRDGRFTLSFRLDAGPGYYLIVCHVRPKQTLARFAPATAALITASPVVPR